MNDEIIPLAVMLISGYFVLKNQYFGASLIILIASSIYLGYVIAKGKGKREVEVKPQPPNIIKPIVAEPPPVQVPPNINIQGYAG